MSPDPLSADMFHEIMLELRHVRDQVDKARSSLEQHIREESEEFARLRQDIGNLSDSVSVLKTKLGMIAGVAGLLAAGLFQGMFALFF